ncbi:TIGR01459 family HAD-type hydrolase [Kaistia defluvii]|uniref:TIGR01459 family HAD-type hydrolase n=1 Tax=Kaistia defluvii TaxID=410841 RepID=UPI002257537A|nr:TIGR01459 family HAD-type hydrolase [Kaistia defluvii]MCX5520522.1 TIGR01459 family HAD-type hydrolase [Kaistia defluvii]
MTNTTSPIAVSGLSELAAQYRAVLCDVWGVIHNGVRSFAPACDALARYRAQGGTVVLITNAPRTSHFIVEQMGTLGVSPDCYDAIVTSGDVTRALLVERGSAKTFHVGSEREKTLYDGLELQFVGEGDAELISCTGLFDDTVETPDDYAERFAAWHRRGLPMICANPDIVVERGDRFVWCAGSLAERYKAIGGTSYVAGKPNAPIYEAALKKAEAIRGGPIARDAVIAIGDGAPTDLRGACDQNLDVLFVTGGIHSASFGPTESPEATAVHRFLDEKNLGARAFVPHLTW